MVYLALFALNAFGVKLGARAIATLATLKLTPLFALAAIGIWFIDPAKISFSIADVPSFSALGASMVLVMFAYSGMETALVPSGELRDPARSVPRATIAAILLVVLLYLGLQIAGQTLLGPALATSSVPLADTAAALWAPGRTLLLLTAAVSMTGFLMGNLLGTSRLVFALGRDGYLPRQFGRRGDRLVFSNGSSGSAVPISTSSAATASAANADGVCGFQGVSRAKLAVRASEDIPGVAPPMARMKEGE